MDNLIKAHRNLRDSHFTRIISTLGGDANFMINMTDATAQDAKMWKKVGRKAFYDFWCLIRGHSGEKYYVVVEVDATDFSHKIRKADARASNLYVHCTKREFDFILVAEGFQDLEENCGGFARDLVKSLHVK
jgi:hypothetical protein